MTTKFNSPLRHVKIAAPCTANWDEMFSFGDDRVRFCSQCERNVYNLSALKRREAEALLTTTEGRLCVRFYRRADGTVLTDNCPIGLRALKRRMSRAAQFVMGMMVSFVSLLGLLSVPPIRDLIDRFTLRPALMGAMVGPSEAYNEPAPFVGRIEAVPEQGNLIQIESKKLSKPKAQQKRR